MSSQDAEEPLRVLIVDDDLDVCATYEDILEENDIQFVSCSDGISGLEKITNETFDLVILDSDMPEMDGATVSRLVRFDLGKKNIPIVLISGLNIEFDEIECMKLGFNGFLRKPVTQESLINLIHNSITNFREEGECSWTST